MTFAALEIVVEETTSPEDDIVHICCIYCDPDHMFCGLIVEGQDWVANPKPEDECVVCNYPMALCWLLYWHKCH